MAEIEFRDGPREIPDHLAEMMYGIDTFTMTMDEAIQAANKLAERRVVDRAMDGLLKNHFSGEGPGIR